MKRPLSTKACVAALVLCGAMSGALSSTLRAQEVRGIVLSADGVTPAAGVVAVLMHTGRPDSIVARTVTNERGRFTLASPSPFSATLRLLRVGFQPTTGGTFTVAAGEVRETQVTLNDVRIELATRNVRSASRCEIRPDGAQAVAQLFLQARTALIATTTAPGGRVAAEFVNYDRMQTRRGSLMSPVKRHARSATTLKPYASLSVDSLEKSGYMVYSRGEYMYYGPDADVLLSDKFLSEHCLQYVAKHDSLEHLVGVAFKPVRWRGGFVDIEGTLWLDRVSSELHHLDFTYTSLPDDLKNAGLGGRVDYSRMANGVWFISDWSIRMPVLQQQTSRTASGSVSSKTTVAGQQIVGGTVRAIFIGGLPAYLNAGADLAGQSSADKVVAAEVDVTRIRSEPGSVITDAMIRDACTNVRPGLVGMVRGTVVNHLSEPHVGATVTARWRDDFRFTGDNGIARWSDRTLETTTIDGGAYALCGLGLDRNIAVSATRNAGETGARATTVRLQKTSPVAEVHLTLSPPSQ
jgi:hypothetical protein